MTMKKKIEFAIIAVFLPLSFIFGQSKSDHFLFSDFRPAEIIYNNKKTSKGELNYNKATREMVFVGEDGKNKALYPVNEIDTIYIGETKFIPYGKEFYEVLPTANIISYGVYRCDIRTAGQNTGYGTSSTAAIHDISNIASLYGIYDLKLPDNYKPSPYEIYYIQVDGDLKRIKRAKDIGKLFPTYKKEIAKFLKENKSKEDREEIIAVLNYVSGLM